ncbi:MAG: Gfo/Idh/MocA family oxidoreductase [Verrucomicrobiota bacterium]
MPLKLTGSPYRPLAASARTVSLAEGEKVGFALVGLGRLSLQQLIPAFRASKHARLTALVSGDAAKGQRIAQENGIPPEAIYDYRTFDRLCENKQVHAVYIVLPNSMHAEFTVRAAKAGKHVLCEKPMEVSTSRCQEMIDACKKAGVKLMIAYRIQYEPMNRAMQRMAREEAFGSLKFIEAVDALKVEKLEWRLSKKLSGSGAVGDLGIYCINTIRFLLGEEPTEVFARTFRPANDPRFREVDATVVWQMRFPSGILANCMCSFDAHETKSYRIVADGGTFGMDPAFSYRGLKSFSRPEKASLPQPMESNQFTQEIDHMADCIRHDRLPATPGEEGLQDQRIIEAIFESARTSRAVRLPRYDKLDLFRQTATP